MSERACARWFGLFGALALVFMLLSDPAAAPAPGADTSGNWARQAVAEYVCGGQAPVADRGDGLQWPPDEPTSRSDHALGVAETFRYDDSLNPERALARLGGYRLAPRSVTSVADDLGGAACSFSAATAVVMADGTRRASRSTAPYREAVCRYRPTGRRGATTSSGTILLTIS